MRSATRGLFAATLCFAASQAHAITAKVTVENLAHDGGLWFTPVFFGFHDGSFDMFNPGDAASSSVEAIAEGGDASGLLTDITSVAGAKSALLTGTMGPPGVLFGPGGSNSFMIDIDSALNRYLSFASMIIPSNDAFIANAGATDHELFDANGKIKQGFTINLFGANIWDAGTELNDGMGAAFSTLGGMSTDTSDPIGSHTGLDLFVNTSLPTNEDLLYAFDDYTPVARITVEQVPDSTAYIGTMSLIALLGFQTVVRKRAR